MLNIDIKKEIIFPSTVFLLMFLFFWNLSGEKMKKDPVLDSELVIVFKKEISNTAAKQIMNRIGNDYRPGMDSSRGKTYFYKTGPKFIVNIDRDRKSSEISRLKKINEVYEVYEPDWKIQKD